MLVLWCYFLGFLGFLMVKLSRVSWLVVWGGFLVFCGASLFF